MGGGYRDHLRERRDPRRQERSRGTGHLYRKGKFCNERQRSYALAHYDAVYHQPAPPRSYGELGRRARRRIFLQRQRSAPYGNAHRFERYATEPFAVRICDREQLDLIQERGQGRGVVYRERSLPRIGCNDLQVRRRREYEHYLYDQQGKGQ